MSLNEKLQTLTTKFTTLKETILAKISAKNELIHQEKNNHQETISKLETTLKEQATNEQILDKLTAEFEELTQALAQDDNN
ncbi:MAG: hypothetical protein GBAus27B_000270 [Mycoplasmataceae bacterium]|nr:MAG: hypothetical protein GBAus27B_000270 [Mycoplasmataceae bacterium]